MSRLRPNLLRLILLTFLGLATTITLAWLLAAFLPHRNLSRRFNLVGTPAQYITIYELSRPGMIRRALRPGYIPAAGAPQLWQLLAPDATLALHLKTTHHDRSWGDLPAALDHPTKASLGAEDARGWPFLCLWCSLDESAIEGIAGSQPVRGGYPISRLTAKSTAADFRALPLTPIWRGLLADTAIFATGWAIAIPLFLAARNAIRRRRGLCPACAYDLQHNLTAGCPECGHNRPFAAR